MNNFKITVTSYLNAVPFVYGIKHYHGKDNYILQLEVPSVCAENIINNQADIALVPIATLLKLKNFNIITDFCIGAVKQVQTVLLLSQKPVEEIKTIHLDFESRTSVELVKVLADNFWKLKDVAYVNINKSSYNNFKNFDSVVAIGDKTFQLTDNFHYKYDLAEEWYKWTGLPFVFACWVSSIKLSNETITNFNNALAFGVENKVKAVKEFRHDYPENIDIEQYVERYINYDFDELKRKALDKFLSLINS